jgi:hypothetical protein
MGALRVSSDSRDPAFPSSRWPFDDLGVEFEIAGLVAARRGGRPMIAANQPSAADVASDGADQVDEAALTEVMRVVPLGAGVVAGVAVALLVIGYLAIYLLVFVPRGGVG